MAQKTMPCAPMRAHENHRMLRGFLRRCHTCGDYLQREDCLDVVVRLSHWLQKGPHAIRDRIRAHLAAKR